MWASEKHFWKSREVKDFGSQGLIRCFREINQKNEAYRKSGFQVECNVKGHWKLW